MSDPRRSSVPVQIRFNDVDLAQHVHNAVYLHWFELARMAHLERILPADHDWKAQGLILARNEVDYRMPVRLNDTIVAEAWVSAIGGKRFDLSYAIHRTQGERPGLCAEGRSVLVCFNYVEQRTIAVPEAWRGVLQELLIQ